MKLTPRQVDLARALGHDFSDPRLLVEAVTHASVGRGGRDNQRLEFLGDRVLGLVIAEALLTDAPAAREGDLAPWLNTLVRKETCAEIAAEIGLGPAMLMGRSEQVSGGRRKTALLGDAMEAVIAAIYLDAGFAKARETILRLWAPRIADLPETAQDAKTALQEWAQARGLAPPDYLERGRSGPDHAPEFEIEARLATGESAAARAGTKRAAQQAAAAALLAQVEGERA